MIWKTTPQIGGSSAEGVSSPMYFVSLTEIVTGIVAILCPDCSLGRHGGECSAPRRAIDGPRIPVRRAQRDRRFVADVGARDGDRLA